MFSSQGLQRAASRLDLVLVSGLLGLGAWLGGSSLQGLDGHLTLQFLAALACLAGLAIGRPVPIGSRAWLVLGLVLAWCTYALIQLVPLPQDALNGAPRDAVFEAWSVLGLDPSGLGISLAPGETISALLAVLPPLAVFFLIATARWTSTIQPVCWTIVILAAGSAALGLGQVVSGADSPLYLHDGAALPLGVFSNPNHQATFLIMALPISVALLIERRQEMRSGDGEIGLLLAAGALFMALVVGIVAAGSGAGFLLLAVIAPLCGLLLQGGGPERSSPLVPLAFFLLVGLGIAVSLTSPLLPDFGWASQSGEAARPTIWSESLAIAAEHAPFGTGLGSFPYVYSLYESPEAITQRYMNAAHSDVLQTVFEMGVIGGLILIAGLLVWGRQSLEVWTRPVDRETRLRRAASIAVLVVILHSMIDYPLRAPFYAMVAAACLAILCVPRRDVRRRAAEQRERRGSERNTLRVDI